MMGFERYVGGFEKVCYEWCICMCACDVELIVI